MNIKNRTYIRNISNIKKHFLFLFIYFHEMFYFKKIALILKTNSMSKI